MKTQVFQDLVELLKVFHGNLKLVRLEHKTSSMLCIDEYANSFYIPIIQYF